jgi:Transglutaminase-like superfamily
MWEALRRFKALEPRARGLFLRAAVLLPFISLSLRLRGFRATQSSLQKHLPRAATAISDPSSGPQASGAQAESTALTARMVRSAAHRTWGRAACLEQSLALWWLLGRQGIASSVRIGTRKTEQKFEAHAWVECEGVALNEPEEPHKHYAAFDEAFPVLKVAKK